MINYTAVPEITPLYKINEIRCWENRPFTTIWPEPQLRKSKGVTRTIRKKARRVRTAFTTKQLQTLEESYMRNKYINAELRRDLAKSLKIGEKSIKVWFQNRRMKEKKDSSEGSSDSSSEILNAANLTLLPLQQYGQQVTQYDVNQHHYNSQYILPNHYAHGTNQNYMQTCNFLFAQTVPDNNATLYHNGNVYPTQYYPSHGIEDMPTDQYNMQGNEIQNYWFESNGFTYNYV